MSKKYFEFSDGKSHKFWEIELAGNEVTVRYGRIGTQGQTKSKNYGAEQEAQADCDKQIAAKVKKGYQQVGAAADSAPAKPRAAAKPAAKTTAPQAPKKTVSEPAKPAHPVSQPVNRQVPTDTAELLGLDAFTMRLASWRGLPPLPKTPMEPFDLDGCIAKIRSAKSQTNNYVKRLDWATLIPDCMSREEAHFWFHATSTAFQSNKNLIEQLSTFTFDGNITLSHAHQIIAMVTFDALAMKPLSFLFEPLELLTFFDIACRRNLNELGEGFHYAVAYVSEQEKDAMREQLRNEISVGMWSATAVNTPTNKFIAAAVLGMHDELLPVIESVSDKTYASQWAEYCHCPQRLIFGLNDPGLVETHMRRLKLTLHSPGYIKAWLAHTETHALDYVSESIKSISNRDDAQVATQAFAEVRAPAAAPVMLDLAQSSKVARTWLEENRALAVMGLAVTVAASATSKLGKQALQWLRTVKRKGHQDFIQACQSRLGADEAEALQGQVLDFSDEVSEMDPAEAPAWLLENLQAPEATKIVTWLEPAELPPIIVDGKRLSDVHVDKLLEVLKSEALPSGHGLITGLKQHADSSSLDAFVWRLFELWLSGEAPSKEKWAMLAMGHLGGDECAMRLTPLIRQWPGESQHKRAVNGLEVLRHIGTTTALMLLNGIAQKVKFRGIKQQAQVSMQAIAADRGITKEELEDLVVPDCGLDEHGKRMFDYGPRQFEFVLGSDLKPKLRDDKGKLRDNPPKPSGKDDPERAPAAEKEWKLVKKQIRDMAAIQALRLEQAMVIGRRWPVARFEQVIAKHPLMIHIARMLLWGGYQNGDLTGTFRITEEQAYADIQDETTRIAAYKQVGIVHPLQLTEADRQAWGEQFSDYALIPPFDQLGREIYSLNEDEARTTEMARFHGLRWPAPSLVFGLDKIGWSRGVAADAGGFDEHSKQFPGAQVTAVVIYEGVVGMGYIDPDEMLTLQHVRFVKGMRNPSCYEAGSNKNALKLGQVDPIVISEVMRDLQQLQAKAK